MKNLIKKHVDTVIVLGGILSCFIWMNKSLNSLEFRINEKLLATENRLNIKINDTENRLNLKINDVDKRINDLDKRMVGIEVIMINLGYNLKAVAKSSPEDRKQ